MKVFDWSRLGDIKAGRENLGELMPVAVYRLQQFNLMDEMTDQLGKEKAEEILRGAGFRSGYAFGMKMLSGVPDFNTFVSSLTDALRSFGIGILRVEKADLGNLDLVLTVSEDLDCSGLPILGDTVCVYDEGFIAGVLECYTGTVFDVAEVDCWATGARTCRFTAKGRI